MVVTFHRKTLLATGTAIAALLAGPALAQTAFQGVPTVVGGAANGVVVQGPAIDTVFIRNSEVIVNWTPNDVNGAGPVDFLPAGVTGEFRVDPTTPTITAFTVLNRILPVDAGGNPANRAISLNGIVLSRLADNSRGGSVWFYSPGGIIAGSGSVFDTGNLVLTANDIDTTDGLFGAAGEIRFRGATDSSAAVVVQGPSGQLGPATLAAVNEGSYIALVAPRVVQDGRVFANGSTALVAAESVDIAINAGLFDIAVQVGTTDPNGIVHSGTTDGPSRQPFPANDAQQIVAVAVPKNDALTMLLGGTIGYAPAVDVFTGNGAVILSAGSNIVGGFAGAQPVSPFAANLELRGISLTSDLNVASNGTISLISQEGSAVTSTASLTLRSAQAITLDIPDFGLIDIAGNLTLQSGSGGQGGSVVVRATRNTIDPAAQAVISIGGNLDILADGIGVDDFAPLGIGGNATGGSARIETNGGGTITVAGTTTLSAIASGGFGAARSGDATGGSVTVASSGIGSLITTGNLFISAQGFVNGANGQPTAIGGTTFGGTITVTADQAGIATGLLLADASAFGGDAGPGGVAGNGTGGTIALTAASGAGRGSIVASGDIALTAVGAGGNGDSAGSGAGGRVALTATSGIITTPLFSARADGNAGSSITGAPGQGSGGGIDVVLQNILASPFAASMNLGDATFSAAGSALLFNEGNIFARGSGGDGSGGTIAFALTGGSFDAQSLTIDASGSGGAAPANAPGQNAFQAGSGTAGSATLDIAGADVSLTTLLIAADGFGGFGLNDPGLAVAAQAGQGQGGNAALTLTAGNLTVGNGTVRANGGLPPLRGVSDPTLPVAAAANGANSIGGTASLSVSGGSVTATTLAVEATGTGLTPDAVANAGQGPAGGAGSGGTASASLSGSGQLQAQALSISGAGIGGAGGRQAGSGTGGTGGAGTGGNAQFTKAGGTLTLASLSLDASGTGGGGGNAEVVAFDAALGQFVTLPGPGSGGSGGDALGGSALATVTSAAVITGVTIRADGFGGRGGDGIAGGAGGNGRAGSGAGGALLNLIDAPLDIASLLVGAEGNGGSGGDGRDDSGGNGGVGTGGDAAITAGGPAALLTVGNGAISASGTGGSGGNGNRVTNPAALINGAAGGDGVGGAATLAVADAAQLAIGGGLQIAANGFGGSGSSGVLGAQGADGTPGDIGQTGGAGGDGGTGGTGGDGGSGSGGRVTIAATRADLTLDASFLSVEARGFGGFAGNGGQGGSGGTGGAGGAGLPGDDITPGGDGAAGGIGGAGGAGGINGNGGTGFGGTLTLAASGGIIGGINVLLSTNGEAAGAQTVANGGTGGAGGAGGSGGIGGPANGNDGPAGAAGADGAFGSFAADGSGIGGLITLDASSDPGTGDGGFGFGTLTLAANGLITFDGFEQPDIAGEIRLTDRTTGGGNLFTVDTLNISARGVFSASGTGLAVQSDGAVITIASTASIDIAGAADFVLAGSGGLSVGSDLALNAGDVITISHANRIGNQPSIQAASISAFAPNGITLGAGAQLSATGNLILGTDLGNIGIAAGAGVTGSSVQLFALNGALNGSGAITATNGDIGISVLGPVSAGAITASGQLTEGELVGGGLEDVYLAPADFRANSIAIGTGGLAIASPGTIVIGNATVTPGNGIALDAANVTLGGATADAITIDAAANASIANLAAANAITVNAGNLISVAQSVVAPDITLSSGDIALDPANAQLGNAATTTTLQLINGNPARVTYIGGAGNPAGYSLSAAEFARLSAQSISLFAPDVQGQANAAINLAPPDLVIGALTLTGAQLGPTGILRFDTPGKARVTGAVSLTGLAPANRLELFGGSAVEVDALTGSIRLTGPGGALAGTLQLISEDVLVASLAAIADLAVARDIAAIDARLAIRDGPVVDQGYLQANAITFTVSNGVFVQNSGAGTFFPDRRGFTAGPGGISIFATNPSGAPVSVVINGQQIDAAGNVVRGLDLIPLITIANAQPGLPAAAVTGSTVNGCDIANVAACRLITPPPPTPDLPPDATPPRDNIEKPVDPDTGAGNLLPTPLIEIDDVRRLGFEPVIDEPVTGAGNDDLWDRTCAEREDCGAAGGG